MTVLDRESILKLVEDKYSGPTDKDSSWFIKYMLKTEDGSAFKIKGEASCNEEIVFKIKEIIQDIRYRSDQLLIGVYVYSTSVGDKEPYPMHALNFESLYWQSFISDEREYEMYDCDWGREKQLEDFIFSADGKDYILEEDAIAYLILEQVLIVKNTHYMINSCKSPHKWVPSDLKTPVLFVDISDILYPGSDRYCITSGDKCIQANEMYLLLKDHLKSKKFGRVRWTCRKRNMQPQSVWVNLMKHVGEWDEEMESFRKNSDQLRITKTYDES